MGGSFDAMMLSHQDALDQAAAKNAAPQSGTSPAAAGFRAPSLHISAFPGHAGAGGGFHVDSDQLKNVAGQMGQDANALQGGLSTLNGEGPLAQLVAAGWETSDNLGANTGAAWDAISSFMQDLQNVYDQMTGNLHKTAANYADANSASATAANYVNTEAA